MADARKGSQTGAGQGREGLDNAYAYACRVGGESTAVFPSPLYFPPIIDNLTLFFCGALMSRANSFRSRKRGKGLKQGAKIKRRGLREGF